MEGKQAPSRKEYAQVIINAWDTFVDSLISSRFIKNKEEEETVIAYFIKQEVQISQDLEKISENKEFFNLSKNIVKDIFYNYFLAAKEAYFIVENNDRNQIKITDPIGDLEEKYANDKNNKIISDLGNNNFNTVPTFIKYLVDNKLILPEGFKHNEDIWNAISAINQTSNPNSTIPETNLRNIRMILTGRNEIT